MNSLLSHLYELGSGIYHQFTSESLGAGQPFTGTALTATALSVIAGYAFYKSASIFKKPVFAIPENHPFYRELSAGYDFLREAGLLTNANWNMLIRHPSDSADMIQAMGTLQRADILTQDSAAEILRRHPDATNLAFGLDILNQRGLLTKANYDLFMQKALGDSFNCCLVLDVLKRHDLLNAENMEWFGNVDDFAGLISIIGHLSTARVQIDQNMLRSLPHSHAQILTLESILSLLNGAGLLTETRVSFLLEAPHVWEAMHHAFFNGRPVTQTNFESFLLAPRLAEIESLGAAHEKNNARCG